MHQNGSEPTDKGDFETRPRPVPPPGAIASASLPGYRRAGVGAGSIAPVNAHSRSGGPPRASSLLHPARSFGRGELPAPLRRRLNDADEMPLRVREVADLDVRARDRVRAHSAGTAQALGLL